MSRDKKNTAGFDTDRYLSFQEKKIRSFLRKSDAKVYIEFGGKLIHDKHSARVLPGYREDAKFELIRKLGKHGEAIFVISGKDIVRKRIRGDFGITYDKEALRVINELRKRRLHVRHVAISLLDAKLASSPRIRLFEQSLRRRKIKSYRFFSSRHYDPWHVSSGEFCSNPFITTPRKLVMIISPGGGSGKFGICLNQLYHELSQGEPVRYLKFETFPIYDLPINHPLNLAYMAASADFYDVVMKDPRHGTATSYKRDLKNYELLRALSRKFPRAGIHLRNITSATHMGVNMISRGIIDDEVVQKEAAAEIARRLIRYTYEVKKGKEDPRVLERVRKVLRML